MLASVGDFRLRNYLARIGFEGPLAPDHATLAALHAAHAGAIPFESLDPLLRRPVSLDLAALQRKMVEGRRGGYCFEQNTLFGAALEAVGFAVTGLAGRVRWMSPPDAPLGPRTHMLLKVDLADGSWIADVGFGGCLLDAPLRLEPGLEQQTSNGVYRIAQAEGLYSLSARQPEGWRTLYVFDQSPQERSDYEMANWYSSTNPRSIFLAKLIMERLAGGRRYKLVNHRLVIEEGCGRVVERRSIDSAEELGRVLRETFRLEAPVGEGEIFARIGSARDLA